MNDTSTVELTSSALAPATDAAGATDGMKRPPRRRGGGGSASSGGSRRAGMARRPADPPITQALADSFLETYAWMARSRHARDRLAYRICEWQRDQISQLQLERGEPSWAERVRK